MLITDHLTEQRHDSSQHARHAPRPAGPRVLIADDQPDVLEALRLLLKAEDFGLETASSPAGDVECFLIKKAMTRFDGNVSQAAKTLGLSRSALYRRLQRYGL